MNGSKVQSCAIRKFCAMLNEAGRRSNYLPFFKRVQKKGITMVMLLIYVIQGKKSASWKDKDEWSRYF